MVIATIVKKRVFNLKNITEEEGLVLRTLLNIDEARIKEMLVCDEHYWDNNLSLEEAINIGRGLRDGIMEMVDSK